MESSLEKAIVFLVGMSIIVIITLVIVNYTTTYSSVSSNQNLQKTITKSIDFYMTNNSLYIVNKGPTQTLGKAILTGYTYNGMPYTQNFTFPAIITGTNYFNLNENLSSASLSIYYNGYFTTQIALKPISLLAIKNMYSSAYVYINNKLSTPLFENLSTYYYQAQSSYKNIKIYSNYLYINKSTSNNTIILPTNFSTSNLNFEIKNISTTITISNTIEINLNNEFQITNFINGKYNSTIPLLYSGNYISLQYCYINCYSNYTIGNYTGPLNISKTFYIYQTSTPKFYIENSNGIIINGEVTLTSSLGNYSFEVPANGTAQKIVNNEYSAKITTFNNLMEIENIFVTNSNTIYLTV